MSPRNRIAPSPGDRSTSQKRPHADKDVNVDTHVKPSSVEQLEQRQLFSAYVVDTAVDVIDAADGLTSLREAIIAANTNAGLDSITFDATTFAGGGTVTLGGTELAITDDLNINGLSGSTITIDGDGSSRVFSVTGSTVAVTDLTVSGGDSAQSGAGFHVDNSVLTLTDSTVTGNRSSRDGGGIYAGSNSAVNLVDSTVSNNVGNNDGGGVHVYRGALSVTNSTLSGNTSGSDGGAIFGDQSQIDVADSDLSTNTSGTGGGIYASESTLTVTNSTLTGNTATQFGGGGLVAREDSTLTVTDSSFTGNQADYGGGISVHGSNSVATIDRSTISGNTADLGGGITNQVYATITVTDSTISGNTATDGGGIHLYYAGLVELNNSTVSGNMATRDGGGAGFYYGGNLAMTNTTMTGNSAVQDGGGIHTSSYATVNLDNTIVSGNTAGGNGAEIFRPAGTVIANGNNLFGHAGLTNAQAFSGFTAGLSDIVATSDGINAALTSILDTTLTNNGGPTSTHALVTGSAAIDSGSDALANAAGLTTDQRGDARFVGTVDIGAYEFAAAFETPSFIVDTQLDVVDNTDGLTSLREAVALANSTAGLDTISFDAVTFASGGTITLGGSELLITDHVTIDNTNAAITVDGNDASRVFNLSASSVNMNNLVITGGNANDGAGINLTGGSLVLTDSTVTANVAGDDGAGIKVTSATLDLSNVIISLNSNAAGGSSADGAGIHGSSSVLLIDGSDILQNASLDDGGGIYISNSILTISNSNVIGNTTAISSGEGAGLGIFNSGSTATISNTTISNNAAGGEGAGLFVRDANVTVSNTTISNNVANREGGGARLRTGGSLKFTNATITGNTASLGGGIHRDAGTLISENTIIAGNTAASLNDVSGVISGSHSLIGDHTSAGGLTDGVNGNIVGDSGTATLDINTILDTTLADNGGSTLTHMLVGGSRALDSGSDLLAGNAGLTADQRGEARFIGTVDMGAVEGAAGSAPTDLALDNDQVAENAANGTLVGTVAVTDSDIGDTHTFALLNDAGGRFTINVVTGEVTVLDGTLLDFETNTSHLITVEVTDSTALTFSKDLTITITDVVEPTAMGETGIVSVTGSSASVVFSGTYVNPVVFASSTQNEADPVAVRIDNLSATGFDIVLAEPSNMDGVHATEQVHYYVFEAGVWELADGSIVEIGTRHSDNLDNGNRDYIGFKHNFASSNLTVLTHLQTNNNQGWYHTRHGNSNEFGVQYLIQTEEIDSSTSLPNDEVVGYLAMEIGSGAWSAGTLFEAIQTSNSVKHNWYQVNYSQSFAAAPAVVSTLSTFDGMDDSNTRIRNTSSTGVQVRVAEDTTKDSETNHTTERVDILAIEAGMQLTGIQLDTTASDIGETGSVSFQGSTNVTVDSAFINPVVFAAVSNNGADPVVVRVDNLSVDTLAGTTSFDLLLAETSNSDGVTAVETVNYIVLEAGLWELADGTKVLVGTHETSTTTLKSNKVFDTISTPSMDNPVVITQLQTNSNTGWVSARTRNKAATSFQVALEPEEGSQVAFANSESIGYLVIEAGSGNWDGMDFFAASTPDQVTQNNYAIDLGGLNAADAYFVGSLSRYDGADPSRIRFSNDLTDIFVKVEEDTTNDSEVNHTKEAIDYFLFTGFQSLSAFDIGQGSVE